MDTSEQAGAHFSAARHRKRRGSTAAIVSAVLVFWVLTFSGCASSTHRPLMGRQEMFEALAGRWCSRHSLPTIWESGELVLTLSPDGLYSVDYGSHELDPPSREYWNFSVTGPGKGVLYLADYRREVLTTLLFKFVDDSNHLYVDGWDIQPRSLTHTRCDDGLAAAGMSVEALTDLVSPKRFTQLAGTAWQVGSGGKGSDVPTALCFLHDGRVRADFLKTACARNTPQSYGVDAGTLPNGGCRVEMPFSYEFQPQGDILLFKRTQYVRADTSTCSDN